MPVRGINVFPSWIEGMLVGILRVGNQFRMVSGRSNFTVSGWVCLLEMSRGAFEVQPMAIEIYNSSD